MTFISYAQNHEDVLLWRALRDVPDGFYIDVGAHHPDLDSVTRAFSDRGWRGINIEPLAEMAARLRAARPRDVTLRLALGAQDGEAPFHVVPGTGLSTLDPAAAQEAAAAVGVAVVEERIGVSTLAAVCRLHAAPEIHFLKIDVEGAERAVLEGADLVRFRPWIVLVEATAPLSTRETHAGWEPILLGAGYRFVWFDGLNRFYVPAERHEQLAPCFRAPPNVFDDFLRVADGPFVLRLGLAEDALSRSRAALGAAEAALSVALARASRARERDGHEIACLRQDNETARRLVADEAALSHAARHELHQTHLRLQASGNEMQAVRNELHQTHLRLLDALRGLEAIRASRSWRVTRLMRGVARRLKRAGEAVPAPAPVPGPTATPAILPPPEEPAAAPDAPDGTALPPLPLLPPPPVVVGGCPGGLVAVHQFHSGSAVGDAITNAMLLTRTLLRAMGYRSEIYTEQPPPALSRWLLPMERLPRHDNYVLIIRHSMGYDRFEQVLALPAPKILLYHNITPTALLARHPVLARYATLGRAQLAGFRGRVHAALADSEYNAVELRRLGIAPVRACTLLFDLASLRRRADAAARRAALRDPACFTVLFVGRINENKNQLALVDAFAAFRARSGTASRLVLVGRDDGPDDAYAGLLRARIAEPGLDGSAILAGPVDDDTLDDWYEAADLYVSLSRHEGFGVPLIEAMAHGVPVLAWPGGAVPFTLDGAGTLLDDDAPAAVAAVMLALADDPERRTGQRARQHARLDRLALDPQRAVLQDALLRAGAAPPADPATVPALRAGMRFTVAGHVNGSYSLAAINRDLARALDAARPGRVRLLPVEGGSTLDLSGVPADQGEAIGVLAHRAPHDSGPELVISQHYPVHVPGRTGDVCVALLFWEESLLPPATIALLSERFDAVVAPTGFVRDALLDSGLRVPVRVIPPALRLEPFLALQAARTPDPAGIHRFLHVSSCFPRKGVDVLLRAWARAFRAGDPVRLVIKGFPNPHNTVAAQLAAMQAADPALAPVLLVDQDLEPDALLALYAGSDTMVLPTRGEGFNLPAAEAMAAGLSLIVTGRGGHADFCAPDGVARPGVRLLDWHPAPSGSHLATPHSVWLEPDEDDLVAALREAVPGDRAVRPGHPVPAPVPVPVLALAPAALADRYAVLATDLLLSPPRGPVRISWVSSWAVRCGVADYSRQLLDALEDADGRIRVLCDRRTPPDGEKRGDRFWPCWSVGDPRVVAPLAAAIAADDADAVVLQHQPGLMSFAALAGVIEDPALRARVVLAVLHNTRHLLVLPASERAAVLAALAGIARVLVHTVADLERLRGLGLDRNVTLLPHGIRPALPARPPARLEPAGEAEPLIGCTGFFLPGKGIDTLIEAFARLRRDWPRARLLLLNAEYDHPDSGAEIERCRALAAERRLGGSVRFETGFLPGHEIQDRLGGCDLLALPYAPSEEASSAALRTALCTGTPVAVTPIALFDEAADAVFRFEGGEPEQVAAGLDALLRDADLRSALAERAGRWIADRQWVDVARRLDGMIEGLVRTRALDDVRPGINPA